MERITGIGGVFFKARDPERLADWYRQNLGIPLDAGQTYGMLVAGTGDQTVWSLFPETTRYFDPGIAPFMLNYRVSDLDAMLAQLREAGAQVDDRVEVYEYGRFGGGMDPEGNRFELWQPRAS